MNMAESEQKAPKMNKLAMISATLTVLWFGSAASEEIAGTGVGNHSCAQFAKFYRNDAKPTVVELTFFSWAQGFMTGWNVAMSDEKGRVDVDLSAMRPDDQKKFLRDYCDKHPLKNSRMVLWLSCGR
jgi:hypothetical protein